MIMPAKRGMRGRNAYRRSSQWKKAVVTLAAGEKLELFDLRGGERSNYAYQDLQADLGRSPRHDGLTSRRSRSRSRRRSLTRGDPQEGRPQQQRADHGAPSRRRSSAALPHHRLQARQVRRDGAGDRDRVRPEPLGAHRAAGLRRRREGATSSRPRGVKVGDTIESGGGGDQASGNALPLETSRRELGPQHRAAAGPRRADRRARPAGSS